MRYLIVVLQGGWCFVGRVLDITETHIVFSHSAQLRRWGTTKGIGELNKGPTAKTAWWLIDSEQTIDRREVRFSIQASGWECIHE